MVSSFMAASDRRSDRCARGSRWSNRSGHSDHEGRHVPTRRVAGHRRRLRRHAVGEHHVGARATRATGCSTLCSYPARRVHRVARVLGNASCDVTSLLRRVRGVGDARVHLEVHVRPATRVARGEDAGEAWRRRWRRPPAPRGGSSASARVLVHRVVAFAVAVPHVDRRAGHRLAAVVDVDDRELTSCTARRRRCRSCRRSSIVMSLRTTPLSASTSGPFEPSPGNGPPVSSGITEQSVTVAAVEPAVVVVAPLVVVEVDDDAPLVVAVASVESLPPEHPATASPRPPRSARAPRRDTGRVRRSSSLRLSVRHADRMPVRPSPHLREVQDPRRERGAALSWPGS